MSQIRKRVAIIGAGISGLTSIKECLDEDLEPICFERTNNFGGLWRYREDDYSVYKSTHVNSSKEFSSLSDFPIPDHYPNFFHNSFMFDYHCRFVKAFGLNEYIRYETEVLEVSHTPDHETTGRWIVRAQPKTGSAYTELFDSVMVCTGHHAVPLQPKFEKQDLFKGEIIHSVSYKTPDRFRNKKVLVVGFGNSATDVAVEMSNWASRAELSTRRGGWVFRTVGPFGLPYDRLWCSRPQEIISSYLPLSVANWAGAMVLNMGFDHETYGLKPKHGVLEQFATISEGLPAAVITGKLKIRPNIREFYERGVIFEDGSKGEFDVVILCTGYKIWLPFLSEEYLPRVGNHFDLFKNVFNPKLSHPKTLGLIGFVQPLGPINTVSEMQARWFCSLQSGRIKLPSSDQMMAEIEKDHDIIRSRYYPTERHHLQINYMEYMSELAGFIGCRPNLMYYFFTDPKLYWHLMTGFFSAYQFRLSGPHSWSGARNAIMDVDRRMKLGLEMVDEGDVNNNYE